MTQKAIWIESAALLAIDAFMSLLDLTAVLCRKRSRWGEPPPEEQSFDQEPALKAQGWWLWCHPQGLRA